MMMLPNRDQLFREVTLRICSSLNIGDALAATRNYLVQYIPADSVGLFYFDQDKMGVFGIAKISMSDAGESLQESLPSFIPADQEISRAIRQSENSGQSVTIFNHSDELPQSILNYFPEFQGRSLIYLLLKINNEIMGGLSLSCQGFDRYTEEHATILDWVKDPIALAMSNARRYGELEHLKNLLAEDNRTLSREIEKFSGTQVVGADFGLRQTMDMVRRVAPLSSPVLLMGETGTGKEVIANTIHLASARRNSPMIRVQCGAVPESLLDSELFGHEKGAFTGATETRRGRFERAQGGTIFLDEIGELTPDAQVKLLRVLQEKEFERVGGTRTLQADVRVIVATHRNLEKMVQDGRFREDLWFRLNVFPIFLPPLRQRREDIPSLVRFFMEKKARELNLEAIPALPEEAMRTFQSYDWPGNVRELQNVVERMLILSRSGVITMPQLGNAAQQKQKPPLHPGNGQAASLDDVQRQHIKSVLQQTQGKVSGPGGAAALLGINPSTLRSRMIKLGITIRHQAE
jgi:transcriptional regulator with GAF, ATPase, and Fis domain